MFPCVVTPSNGSYCVSELQFCDGVMDCPDGSDEPVDCATGIKIDVHGSKCVFSCIIL